VRDPGPTPPPTYRPETAASVSAEQRTAWLALSEEIRSCRRCRLAETRTQAVVYRGSLAPRVVFVGEAPGADEDRTGLPFVGRAGHRLDDAIARLGLGPTEYGVLNVVKCRPPGNRFVRSAAEACRPYLDRQLAVLRPRVLVPLGAWALRTIDPSAPPILKAAGAARPGGPPAVFPLVHPSAVRSRRLAARWSGDVDRLADWLRAASKPL
jgi:uracil-DNA glycosylase